MTEKLHEIAKEFSQVLMNEVKYDLLSLLHQHFVKSEEKTECSVKEAAIHYHVHPNTIRNWIQNGELDSKRIGRKLYVIINKNNV